MGIVSDDFRNMLKILREGRGVQGVEGGGVPGFRVARTPLGDGWCSAGPFHLSSRVSTGELWPPRASAARVMKHRIMACGVRSWGR